MPLTVVPIIVEALGMILCWTKEEFQSVYHWTRKHITIHKDLHANVDIDRLYVKNLDNGKGTKNSVQMAPK